MTDTRAAQATGLRVGRAIADRQAELAQLAVDRQFKNSPHIKALFFGERYQACLRDTEYHIDALAQALIAGEDELFRHYAVWAQALLSNLGLPDNCLTGSFETIRDTLAEELPADELPEVDAMIAAGLDAVEGAAREIETAIPDSAPHAEVARAYLEAVLAGDRRHAAELVRELVTQGVSVNEVYDHVFRAAQHEIGRLWQQGRISVAMEHYATGATQVVMAQFAGEFNQTPLKQRRFIGACVAGEQHELGMRMACDMLEFSGWDVVYLGANTPSVAVVAALHEHDPDVLGLSATLPFRVDGVRRQIDLVRSNGYEQLRIVVGGRPFEQVPGLWRKVGADGVAYDVSGMRRMLDDLLECG